MISANALWQGPAFWAPATNAERTTQANPDELVWQPENPRLRGTLRLTQGQTKLAEADFREAIALAQKMGAKAWELQRP